MDRIALTMNPLRPPQAGFLPSLVAALEGEGKEVRLAAEASTPDGTASVPGLKELVRWADLVVVIGGDGSILRAVHQMMPVFRPVMGVNSGRLGFLSYSADEAPADIARAIRQRDYAISERALLDAVVVRHGAEVNRVTALE